MQKKIPSSVVSLKSRFVITTLALLPLSCSNTEKIPSPISTPGRLINIEAPFYMPPIELPAFRDCSFDIRDFGAVNDAETLNTRAFADAIRVCAEAGGGRVVVPPGIWLTGPIHLESNVNLHIQDGAEIRFSTNFEHYLPVVFTRYEGFECYNYSPLIYARNCTNIAITGEGRLNGQGEPWWKLVGKSRKASIRLYDMVCNNVPVKERVFGTVEDGLRPSFVQPVNCRRVLLEDFTIVDGPMWTIHPVYCRDVVVRGVTISTHGRNGDGVNPDSSAAAVLWMSS
jgi:polygalacturonase